MLKKRVVRVLLPLLFSFCFVFSGFLSVDAFAYQEDDISLTGYVNAYFLASSNDSRVLNFRFNNSGGSTVYNELITYRTNDNSYVLDNGTLSDITQYYIGTAANSFDIIFNYDLYDYYIYISCHTHDMSDTFSPNRVRIRTYENPTSATLYNLQDLSVYYHADNTRKGFSLCGKIPDTIQNTSISVIDIYSNAATVGSDITFEGVVFAFDKGVETSTSQIVNAINNQTTTLDGSIGQAADDVQQSIEDQYSGDPETEFSVDDVITQHNEKMGVLSFGSDVMLQFLDMFQSANVGTAELTLPGFNITVENVEYSVWPDYSFNFEQLNEWVPALMSVIRVMLPAFVWLMVLRYCINVFEKNFLSNGG